MIEIVIPTSNYDELKQFYTDKLFFKEEDDELLIPGHDRFPVRVHLQIEDKVSDGRVFLRYEISKNFLSYCKSLIENQVEFEMIMMHPGGYAARFFDIDKNKLEIVCSSLDEEDSSIDPSEWDCYIGY